MSRLRRKVYSASQSPVAAEVLELRSLLSGASAAVHSAAHHALAASQAPAAIELTQFQVTVQMPDLLGGVVQVPGVLAISPIATTKGSHVTAQVTSAVTLEHIPGLLNVSLKGKVLSSSSNGSTTTVNLAPTGTLKFTTNLSGHIKTSSIRAIAPMTITLDDTGKFTLLETEFKFPTSHGVLPPPFTFLAYTA